MRGQEIRLIDYILLKLSITHEICCRHGRWWDILKKTCRKDPQNALESRQNTTKHEMQWSDVKMGRHPIIPPICIYSKCWEYCSEWHRQKSLWPQRAYVLLGGYSKLVNRKLIKHIDSMENNRYRRKKVMSDDSNFKQRVRKCNTELVIFRWRPNNEVSHIDIWVWGGWVMVNILNRGNSKCKGPEVYMCLPCSGNNKETGLLGLGQITLSAGHFKDFGFYFF